MVGMDFFHLSPGSGDSDFESFGEREVLIDGLWLPCCVFGLLLPFTEQSWFHLY